MCDATRALHQQMFFRDFIQIIKLHFFLFLFPEMVERTRNENFSIASSKFIIIGGEKKSFGTKSKCTRLNKYFFDFRFRVQKYEKSKVQ